MKLKKTLTVLMTSVMLLTFSSSASAAVGIGDTQENAITINSGADLRLFIQNAQDQDWFVYTNNSGVTGRFSAFLNPYADGENFRFGFQIVYNEYEKSELHYADYTTISQLLGGIYVPVGAKVYIVVKKTNDVMTQYQLGFL